jgi:small subunit ribosomal protein S1
MSTPDTPSHDQTPDASPAPNESQLNGDSSSNGHVAPASEGTHQPAPAAGAEPHAAAGGSHPDESNEPHGDESHADDSHADDSHEDAPEGAAAQPGDQPQGDQAAGEKKRRRRRRRKKGDKTAAAAAPGAAVEGAPGPAEGEGEVAAEGAKPSDRPEKREPRREKKSGPPRERPPVNAGDIVFGKIIEIDDDAILIDIPGKARAIFDRREMLLTDDEDAAAAAASPAASAPEAAAHEGAAAEGESHAAAAASPGEEASHEATAAGAEPSPASPGEEASHEATPAEAASSAVAATAEPPAVATPEPPREPKVPRVILEVGADFIGVVHNDGARGGLVVLTHHPKRIEKAKQLVEKASNDKTTVLGLVTGVIKGGIEVDVDGLRAFAPGSHVDLRLGADLSHLVAKRLPFYVTQYAKRGRDVVLSRRAMLEDESRKARTEALSKLKVGEEVEGIVRSVVPFGAFIDVGGIEGLVPLQEMSHNRGDGPNDVFKAGETTRVTVMKIDERGKIWLSHKATIPDPWQQVAQKYATGTRHSGKVVRIQPFGAFIELEPGVDGLLHTADLSVKRIETPDEVVKVGDAIEVVVAHVDPSNHKIALHPALQGAEADEAPQKVGPHKPVKAKIVTIESGGLVVRLLGVTGRNARGYVTAAGTGTPRGTELRKVFKVDQLVDAKVIEMDPRRGEVKLSIKALSEDLERSAYQQYRTQLKAEARFTFGDLLAKKANPPK